MYDVLRIHVKSNPALSRRMKTLVLMFLMYMLLCIY